MCGYIIVVAVFFHFSNLFLPFSKEEQVGEGEWFLLPLLKQPVFFLKNNVNYQCQLCLKVKAGWLAVVLPPFKYTYISCKCSVYFSWGTSTTTYHYGMLAVAIKLTKVKKSLAKSFCGLHISFSFFSNPNHSLPPPSHTHTHSTEMKTKL